MRKRSTGNRIARFASVVAVFASLALAARPAGAALVTWTNPAGGTWTTPAAWNSGLLPGGSDDVVLPTLGPPYTVTVSGGLASIRSISVAPGATLRIVGGGSLAFTDASVVSAGATLELGDAMFGPGMLSGSGLMTVDGSFVWGAGFVQNAGGLVTSATSTTSVSPVPTTPPQIVGSWTNEGAVTLTGPGIQVMPPAAAIFNLAGGSFTLSSLVGGAALVSGPGSATFANEGDLIVTTGANVLFMDLFNTGRVEVRDGARLGVQSPGGSIANDGRLEAAGSGELILSSNAILDVGTVLAGDGRIELGDGASVLTPLVFPGTLALTGGALDLGGSVEAGGLEVNGADASITGAGDLTVTGAFSWGTGAISGTGTLTTQGATTLPTGTRSLATTRWVNTGTVSWTYGDLTLAGTPPAVIENASGAQFDIDLSTLTDGLRGTGSFVNSGTVRKLHGSWVDAPDTPIEVAFDNNGTLDLVDGELTFTATALLTNNEGGTIMGNGILDVAEGFVDFGHVRPGSSPGVLNVTGGYVPTGAATLHIELGGTTPGAGAANHDQVAVAGVAMLDGTLEVTLVPGYTPLPGDTYDVLTASLALYGTFATESLPALGAGLSWSVTTGAAAVTLAVIAAPVAVDDAYATADAAPIVVTDPLLGVLGNDTDADGDTLSASLVTGPSHGTLALATDGTFTYTPFAGASGTDSFTYRADDGTGATDDAVATISLGLTAAPVLAIDPAARDFGDVHPGAVSAPELFIVRNTGTAPASLGTSGSVVIAGAHPGDFPIPIEGDLCSGDTILPMPAAADLTAYSEGYWSAFGGGNDHFYIAMPVAGGITWEAANTFATLAGGYLASVTSSAENDFISAMIGGNPALWSGIDGDIAGPWLGGWQPAGSAEPDGGWRWTTAEAFAYANWQAGFPAQPDDAGGVESRLHYHSTGTGPGPEWSDAAPGIALPGFVIEFDSYPLGWVACGVDIEFQPTAAGARSATLDVVATTPGVTASAALSGNGSNAAPVINDDPTATGPPYEVDEDGSLVATADGAVPGVLDNDADPDGDAFAAAIWSAPTHGSVALAPDGGFVYTPDPDYNGPDAFGYLACDAWGGCSEPAWASVDVLPVNDAPVAAADGPHAVNAGETLAVAAAAGVLANDSDVDGDALTATLVAGPAGAASFTLQADGSFTYVPAAGFTGADSFTYRAFDAAASSAIATVAIVVSDPIPAAPPVPVIAAAGVLGAPQVLPGEPVTVTAALECGGHCGEDADWWIWAETPAGPVFYDLATGTWSATPAPAAQAPLGTLATTVVLDGVPLAAGPHVFRFSVDQPADGVRDDASPWAAAAFVSVGGGFYEDFEDGVADGFIEDGTGAWRVAAVAPGAEHGARVYRAVARGGPRVFFSRTAERHADFTFGADVRLAGGGTGAASRGMGLIFRSRRNYRSTYVFHIDARGYFLIFKRTAGVTARLGRQPLRWIASRAIRRGTGAWNRVEVTCIGPTIVFRINGEVVATRTDRTFDAGAVGLKAFGDGGAGDVMEFDNVALRREVD